MTFKQKLEEELDKHFPKLNHKDVSKPSPNHRSQALALFAMACVFHQREMEKQKKEIIEFLEKSNAKKWGKDGWHTLFKIDNA